MMLYTTVKTQFFRVKTRQIFFEFDDIEKHFNYSELNLDDGVQ